MHGTSAIDLAALYPDICSTDRRFATARLTAYFGVQFYWWHVVSGV
jgi:hypothetical protein